MAGWYVGLTSADVSARLRRSRSAARRGGLIIAAYVLFVVVLLAVT